MLRGSPLGKVRVWAVLPPSLDPVSFPVLVSSFFFVYIIRMDDMGIPFCDHNSGVGASCRLILKVEHQSRMMWLFSLMWTWLIAELSTVQQSHVLRRAVQATTWRSISSVWSSGLLLAAWITPRVSFSFGGFLCSAPSPPRHFSWCWAAFFLREHLCALFPLMPVSFSIAWNLLPFFWRYSA